MESLTLSVYSILNTGAIRYRILYIRDDKVIGCRMDTTKLLLDYIPMPMIEENLLAGAWKIELEEQGRIVDVDSLSETAKAKYLVYKACMSDVVSTFGPTYIELSSKAYAKKSAVIMRKYNLKPFVFRKLCREYLQSGCKDSALIDKRSAGFSTPAKQYDYKKRAGRKSESGAQSTVIIDGTVKKYFEEAVNAYKSGRQTTLQGTYEDMLKQHYMTKVVSDGAVSWELMPSEQIPTFRQFYSYAAKSVTKEDKDAIRTSKQEQRNNKRLLLSDTMKGVHGPGDMVEVDALESDIFLVSERDREQTIGRGILYLMIDVWTRVILAMSVSFENNSVLACTDLFLNLADDKVEYAKQYGITFSPNLWPSGIIPRRMRVDRGADFRSDALESILNGLGIERLLESAATGSMKGVVEQEFRQIQFNQNDIVENNGLIEKRHDSRHHEEAKLTINEFTKMCINYVLTHNQKYQKYYKMNKKMMDAHIEPVPIVLWDYGCKLYGAPRPIADKEQYYWNLLTPAKASLNREGLKWKGLYYLNYSDRDLLHEMYAQQNKVKKMDVKYDPRDIGQLYYMRNGKLMRAALNEDKFGNEGYNHMTYKEYSDYLKAKKAMDKQGQYHNLKASIGERTANRSIVDSVQPVHYSDASNMREERETDRQNNNRENSIAKRLDDVKQEETKALEAEKASETSSSNPPHKATTFAEALREFYEETE